MRRTALAVMAALAVAGPATLVAGCGSSAGSNPGSAQAGAQAVRDPDGHLAHPVPLPSPQRRDVQPKPPAVTPAATTSSSTTEHCPKGSFNVNGTNVAAYFCHAGAQQRVANQGAYVTTTVQSPWVVQTSGTAQGDHHSLFELAVESDTNTSVYTDNQIVEIGWRVSPESPYNDEQDHLFVYYWVNGVAHNCYVIPAPNNTCPGYHSNSSTITPGMVLNPGTSVKLGIEYSGGNWWFLYNSTWFGYIAGSEWSGTYTQSNVVQMFGEVSSPYTDPCTNMGNGNKGSSGSGATATGVGFWPTTITPNLQLNHIDWPAYYDAKILSTNSFAYGGPGATAADTGNRAGC